MRKIAVLILLAFCSCFSFANENLQEGMTALPKISRQKNDVSTAENLAETTEQASPADTDEKTLAQKLDSSLLWTIFCIIAEGEYQSLKKETAKNNPNMQIP